jgi:hypothetical protein
MAGNGGHPVSLFTLWKRRVPTDRRIATPDLRAMWKDWQQEREDIERRLRLVEIQTKVLTRMLTRPD